MPVPLSTFLTALFQVHKQKLFRSRGQDLEAIPPPLETEEHQQAEYCLQHDL